MVDDASRRIREAAPELIRLLVRLEALSYANALPCPFCDAPEGAREDGLAHDVECELDRVLFDTGARRVTLAE